MSDDVIMLAKTYDPDKISFPVEITIKLDGVAADFYKTTHGWVCQSRQGKPLPSTHHILRLLNQRAKHYDEGTHVVGELTVMGVPAFKDAAGIIRRHEPDERIVLNVYDMYIVGKEEESYALRLERIEEFLNGFAKYTTKLEGVFFQIIRRVPVVGLAATAEQLCEHLASMDKMLETTKLEGFVIRMLHGKHSIYRVGKRSHGLMRYKPCPTVDLRVIRFEEATANKTMTFLDETFEKGQGLRAVGRIVCEYKGKEIGVGPGCLSHAERRKLWEWCGGPSRIVHPLIAEVEYMLDDDYEALRQPIFKQWRTDKTTPSEEA